MTTPTITTGTPVVVSRIQNRRGTQAQFDALYPTGQPGSGPNILQPGELALITDPPGKLYIGSLNGTYIEITTPSIPNGIVVSPLVVQLATANQWTAVLPPFAPTPFITILYSVADSAVINPNIVGTSFSRNGELQITCTTSSATLTDIGTEENSTTYDISFSVSLINNELQLSYMHNFPSTLIFSTGSIIWSSI